MITLHELQVLGLALRMREARIVHDEGSVKNDNLI